MKGDLGSRTQHNPFFEIPGVVKIKEPFRMNPLLASRKLIFVLRTSRFRKYYILRALQNEFLLESETER